MRVSGELHHHSHRQQPDDIFSPVHRRSLSATLDSAATDRHVRDLTLREFGLTPFLETEPDFVAGAAVMIPALLVSAGFDVSLDRRVCIS